MIGAAQGTVIAKIGVPSFVVTLAGLLIWQGVILQVLELRGVIIIEDQLDQLRGDVLLLCERRLAHSSDHHGGIRPRRAGRRDRPTARGSVRQTVDASRQARGCRCGVLRHCRDLQPRDEAGGVPGGHTAHGELHAVAGSPAGCAPDARLPRRTDVPREAHDIRTPRLRGRRQRRGCAARGDQRRARPDPRVHDLRDHGRGRRDGPRRAAAVGEPAARGRDAAPRLDLGRRHRRREPLRRSW